MSASRRPFCITVGEDVAEYIKTLPHGEPSKLFDSLAREYIQRQSKNNREALLRQLDENLGEIDEKRRQRKWLMEELAEFDRKHQMTAQAELEMIAKETEERKLREEQEEMKMRAEMAERASRTFEQYKDTPCLPDLIAKVKAEPNLATDKAFLGSCVDVIRKKDGPHLLGVAQLKEVFRHVLSKPECEGGV